MAIAITGVTGFIGRNLLESLLKKNYTHPIYLWVRQTPPWLIGLSKQYSQLQIISKVTQLPPQIDALIHLAARASQSPTDLAANLSITEELLNYATHNRCSRFIFVSSLSVLGEYGEVTRDIDETSPFLIQSPYAENKKQCEVLCRRWQQKTQRELWVLRPALMYGHYDRGPLHQFLSLIAHFHFAIHLGSPPPLKYWTSVDLLVNVIEQILQLEVSNCYEVLHVTDSTPHSLSEVTEIVQKLSKFKIYKIEIANSIVMALSFILAIIPGLGSFHYLLRKALYAQNTQPKKLHRIFPHLNRDDFHVKISQLRQELGH